MDRYKTRNAYKKALLQTIKSKSHRKLLIWMKMFGEQKNGASKKRKAFFFLSPMAPAHISFFCFEWKKKNGKIFVHIHLASVFFASHFAHCLQVLDHLFLVFSQSYFIVWKFVRFYVNKWQMANGKYILFMVCKYFVLWFWIQQLKLRHFKSSFVHSETIFQTAIITHMLKVWP